MIKNKSMKQKKVLVTGVTGQDGIFLLSELYNANNSTQFIGITRNNINKEFFYKLNYLNKSFDYSNLKLIELNFLNPNEVSKIVMDFQPNYIYNFSGPSNVNLSITDPITYYKNLIVSFVNIIESVKKSKLNINIFQASSSEMFAESKHPLNENSLLSPRNPYSLSKFTIHEICKNLYESGDINCKSGILFNHESEFRSDNFLIMKIINAAIKIKSKNLKKLVIGSLDISRDWTYALDTVNASILINENGKNPTYVVGSGKSVNVKEILDFSFSFFDLNWEKFIEIDSTLLRRGDALKITADPQLIKNSLGWTVNYSIEDMIEKTINFKFN